MARIIVFGAAGKAGRLITQEAARRGHTVLAVAREVGRLTGLSKNVTAKSGDATSAPTVLELAAEADAIILAVGGADNTVWKRAAQAAIEALTGMRGRRPRVLHMGGGATLLTPDGKRYLDLPGFPEMYRGPAAGQAEALEVYRQTKNPRISWTYLSPPPVQFELGQRTGKYRTALDSPVEDDRGEASISYEDFAVAMIDEIETPRFLNRRFTVGY